MARRETNRGFALDQVSSQALSNSTAETTLFTAAIPAGAMGTSKKLKLEALCTLTTPLLSLPALTVKIKLGSATLAVVSNIGLAASQTNAPFTIEATIKNRESRTSQIVYARITQQSNSLPMLIDNSKAMFANWNIDTAVAQTLSITGQFSLLSGSTSLTMQDVDIELS